MQSLNICTSKSLEIFNKSKEIIPGGVNSPVRAFKAVDLNPLVIASAKGSRIRDVDGNEYIDYVCSWGASILGAANERVVEAVKKASEDGLSYGAPTKKEYILAKLIVEAVPAIEKVRMVSSGTEAVMSAIRLARAYTGRDMIIKFKGCYHGHSDGLLVKAGSGAMTAAVSDSAGVINDYAKNTLVASYNDIDTVEKLMKEFGDTVAAIIVEPVAANMGVVLAKDEFLRSLRNICDKYKSLLIFDEVITGFRISYSGAGAYYDVKPDIITLGKIVGGGMPLAAYGGRADIMDMVSPVGDVYQAGTLSGNPIAVSAGIETINILKENLHLYKDMQERAVEFKQAIEDIFYTKGIAVRVNQIASLLCIFFIDTDVDSYEAAVKADTKMYARYFKHMLESGIYIAPSQFEAMFISTEHSKEQIQKTIEAIRGF